MIWSATWSIESLILLVAIQTAKFIVSDFATVNCELASINNNNTILHMQSHIQSKNGKFQSSKMYGNASALLSVVAIIAGFIVNFIGLIICVIYVVAASRCGLSHIDSCL